MPAGQVTALIGPSGCGKSTFLRILNRMHELIPAAKMAGEVSLDGHDIYAAGRRLTDARREIGMVFQKPNPFPAMSIYENVVAGLKLTGTRVAEIGEGRAGRGITDPRRAVAGGQGPPVTARRSAVGRPAATPVHRALAGRSPAGAADGRAVLGAGPDVDPGHRTDHHRAGRPGHHRDRHAQHAAGATRVEQCAFFLAEQGTPGVIVESGPTDAVFGDPQDPRTSDYVRQRSFRLIRRRAGIACRSPR